MSLLWNLFFICSLSFSFPSRDKFREIEITLKKYFSHMDMFCTKCRFMPFFSLLLFSPSNNAINSIVMKYIEYIINWNIYLFTHILPKLNFFFLITFKCFNDSLNSRAKSFITDTIIFYR